MPQCSTYLEVGVWRGETFRDVRVPFKWGVDPLPLFNPEVLPRGSRLAACGSDEFFETLDPQIRFDLVFLDGLHLATQTYKDFINAWRHGNPWTIMLIDDVRPDDDFSAIPDHQEALRIKTENGIHDGRWHGDVWKIVPTIANFHPEFEVTMLESGVEGTDNVQAMVYLREGHVFSPEIFAEGYRFIEDLEGAAFSRFLGEYPERWSSVAEEVALQDKSFLSNYEFKN